MHIEIYIELEIYIKCCKTSKSGNFTRICFCILRTKKFL